MLPPAVHAKRRFRRLDVYRLLTLSGAKTKDVLLWLGQQMTLSADEMLFGRTDRFGSGPRRYRLYCTYGK